jgi:predicted RNA polymerase sigma factor
MTVAKRRAIDTHRRRVALDERYATLARDAEQWVDVLADDVADEVASDGDLIADDVLALVFTACHPLLSPEARVALTLRVVGGLTSDEIAKAFLVPTATVQARITRAKKTLSAAHVPFEVPPRDDWGERLGSVLSVVYVIFTEGSTASSGDSLIRRDLAHEALRLARVLTRLVPNQPEAFGLLALLELTAARFPARVAADGTSVLLADQDRRRWDHTAIRRGRAALRQAAKVGRGLGFYGLQAAIAECHAVAPTVETTDWDRVVVLYEALGRLAPSPVVDLNRAVALSMAQGPAAGLRVVDELAQSGRLAGTHLLPSVRGELLARLGRREAATAEFRLAIERCDNSAERAVLERKLNSLDMNTLDETESER